VESYVDRIAKVERGDQFGEVVRIGVQVIAIPGLVRAPMASAIVCDAPVSAGGQENHLVFPSIGAQGPAVTEDDWLAFSPILEVDLRTIFGCESRHGFLSVI
jgi:hypothetical protein